jgi:RNA polymerase sigma factor (sigma-70 family)
MNDLEFVQRCVRGDKLAWDEFVERYSRLIYNYIYSVINSSSFKSHHEDYVNDIFQEIFVLLSRDNFKKLNTFKAKNGCSLASWLRQVVINYTIDYLRKFKTPLVSLDVENEEETSLKDILADDSVLVSDTLALKEKIAQLKECIKGLDTDDKYFLQLYLVRGLLLEELKDVFRVSRGAIDMRKTRIIERLKECFKRKGFLLDS